MGNNTAASSALSQKQAAVAEQPRHRVDISLVVPVYREQANIRPFLARAVPVLEKIGSYEILFCVDPSPDETEAEIEREIEKNPNIGLLLFSRRFGQPAAVIAGIHHCRGRTCAVIDVDLQDPPELIADLHAKLATGYDAVMAKRRSRKGETLLKRFVSWLGYKVISSVSDVNIPRDTGDFRIISARVVAHLREFKEGHGFLRGLVALVGFKQTFIEYDRDVRHDGKGNYNRYLGSLKIGLNGLVGFSNFLLNVILVAGLFVCFFSFVVAVYFIVAKLVVNQPFPLGTPTIIMLVLFMGGVQMISIGILGLYIGRVYEEVKERPQYIIAKKKNVA